MGPPDFYSSIAPMRLEVPAIPMIFVFSLESYGHCVPQPKNDINGFSMFGLLIKHTRNDILIILS